MNHYHSTTAYRTCTERRPRRDIDVAWRTPRGDLGVLESADTSRSLWGLKNMSGEL